LIKTHDFLSKKKNQIISFNWKNRISFRDNKQHLSVIFNSFSCLPLLPRRVFFSSYYSNSRERRKLIRKETCVHAIYHSFVGWLITKIIDRWCQNQHKKDDDAQQLSVDHHMIFFSTRRRKKRQSKIEIRPKLDFLDWFKRRPITYRLLMKIRLLFFLQFMLFSLEIEF
jgi:hypothetical protein